MNFETGVDTSLELVEIVGREKEGLAADASCEGSDVRTETREKGDFVFVTLGRGPEMLLVLVGNGPLESGLSIERIEGIGSPLSIVGD